jgi:energy-coupling factor transport system substrate-specific component
MTRRFLLGAAFLIGRQLNGTVISILGGRAMKSWNMREIVIMVVLSIACGVIYMPWAAVYNLFMVPFGPLGGEFTYGFWFIASVLAAYIIRKPGAAFAGEMVAALVELAMGSVYGPSMLISAAIQGAASELAFAMFRYRKYSLPVLALAGIFPAIGSFVFEFFRSYFETMSGGMIAASLGMRMVSGALLTGLLGKVLSDLLAGTGVLNNYAIVRDKRNNTEAF